MAITPLPRSNPEAEGIASSAVLNFIQAIEQHEHPLDALHGFMLLRHGKVAAEGWWAPYGPQFRHSLFSLSKSFASTAIGIAVSEGMLSVDDAVLKFFPDDAPPQPGENLRAMRVRHLLSMNTGHAQDATGAVFRGEDENWPRAFLALPVEHQPGSWFVYNTAATYMLSAIITQLTGQTLLEYLRPRLFEPLGIENPHWETDPQGRSLGGSGLHIKTEDIARFGQMYLQKGAWQGRQLVPTAWIAEATSAHSDNSNTQSNPDWKVGYGYQFWRCRHGAYRGDGAFGQYCVVLPAQDAVLVINSGLRDMQAVLDKVWQHLLPALHDAALPADAQGYAALCNKLQSLSLPMPQGQALSPLAPQWSETVFELEENDLKLKSVALKFSAQGSRLTVRNECGEYQVEIGGGTWRHSRSNVRNLRGRSDEPVAACGAWTGEQTYEAHLCFTESEIGALWRWHYGEGGLNLAIAPNVAWGPATVTTIKGREG